MKPLCYDKVTLYISTSMMDFASTHMHICLLYMVGDTQLVLKQLTPVRLLKNEFYREVVQAEQRGASVDELKQLLGRARAKLGMFEGDLRHGELEIGQVSGLVDAVVPAKTIVEDMWAEFLHGLHQPIPGSNSMV